eukprot:423785_1
MQKLVIPKLKHLLDGSMGKYLVSNGLPHNSQLWSSLALVEEKYHDLIVNAHIAYLNCGCNVITTNNYAVTPGFLPPDLIGEIKPLAKLSTDLAQTAIKQFVNQQSHINNDVLNKDIKIAGSLPPLMESYRPDLRLSENESIKYYTNIIEGLNECDIFLAETMGCIDEAIYALKSMHSVFGNMNNKETWISFALADNGDLYSDETINDALIKMEEWIECCNISILSINCCTPENVDMFFKNNKLNDKSLSMMEKYNIHFGLYPNLFVMPETLQWTYKQCGGLQLRDMTEEHFHNEFMMNWLEQYGVRNRISMIGGCCGLMPNHMKYMIQHIYKKHSECVPDVSRQLLSKQY